MHFLDFVEETHQNDGVNHVTSKKTNSKSDGIITVKIGIKHDERNEDEYF